MKFSLSDALVSGAVVSGVCGLLWLFVADLNAVSTREGHSPLGTVVFKKLSATRRPTDGLGWERMRNNSPVYDADTLRTANFSEAAVYFEDGTSLDLGENSMLKLSFGGPVRNLEFLEGEISVGGSASDSSYAISSQAGTIQVGKGSSATFSHTGDSVSVEVNKGVATLVRADGSTQAIGENQEFAVDVKTGAASFVPRPIVPTAPARNARLMSLSSRAEVPLAFSWVLEGGASAEAARAFTLELSASRDFGEADQLMSTAVTGLSASVPVRPGTWYWRLRDASGNSSPVRKFSLVIPALPRPAFPIEGAAYSYRRIKPQIRFAWTSMEEAGSYLFEIASSPSFEKPRLRTRVSGTNLSVDDLDAGTWYWRVKPIHSFTEVDAVPESAVRSFTIAKSGEMGLLTATTPFEGMLYQIQELDGKGLSFAWVPNEEAVSYELIVSASGDLSSPALTVPSNLPYLRLVGAQSGALRTAGKWYWGVRWLDREGNRSPVSAARRLDGVDGSIAIRPVFPPDGYRIADSLASNTRFTWKSNIAAKTLFLVSKNADCSDPVFIEAVHSDTLLARAWPAGRYYWKLRTMNADGSVFMETSVRSFTIVEPLPGPTIVKPASGVPFYLREHDPVTLSWNAIEGADYYTLALYSPRDGYLTPLFERASIVGTSLPLPLGELPSGSYRVRIQGFAIETDNSTRIIGYIGEGTLAYRRISYLVPGSPLNGSSIAGLEARRKGISLRYLSENPPEDQEFILYRDGGEVVARSPGRGDTYLAKKVAPGRYAWTVKGHLAGFDISAKDTFRFDVLPIKPLPGPTLLEPAAGAVFGADLLRQSQSISFRWDKVAGATRYILSIYPQGGGAPAFVAENIAEGGFVLADLSPLARGGFIWKVEAQSCDASGELEQPGLPAESSFVIDLPPVRRPAIKEGASLYGH